jgi:hypothetical protein
MLSELKNLKTALETIKGAIAQGFTAKKVTVEILDPVKQDFTVPGVLLDLDQFDEGRDAGDEKFPYECSLTAYCILNINTPDLPLAIKDFAAELAKLIKSNNWNLKGASLPKDISAQPASLNPDKKGYEAWAVTWKQTFSIGDSVWESTFPAPSIVKFSYSPDIGIPHEPDYFEIGGGND